MKIRETVKGTIKIQGTLTTQIIGYINYQKYLDNVYHTGLLKVLEIYNINTLQKFLKINKNNVQPKFQEEFLKAF